mmetsp:Transcript_154397/g.495082  ORF Transcript_154397/g.495082 Transcript_154397/m.495082 type:complete len:573 (-) Transcript_154397:852-2570(-)
MSRSAAKLRARLEHPRMWMFRISHSSASFSALASALASTLASALASALASSPSFGGTAASSSPPAASAPAPLAAAPSPSTSPSPAAPSFSAAPADSGASAPSAASGTAASAAASYLSQDSSLSQSLPQVSFSSFACTKVKTPSSSSILLMIVRLLPQMCRIMSLATGKLSHMPSAPSGSVWMSPFSEAHSACNKVTAQAREAAEPQMNAEPSLKYSSIAPLTLMSFFRIAPFLPMHLPQNSCPISCTVAPQSSPGWAPQEHVPEAINAWMCPGFFFSMRFVKLMKASPRPRKPPKIASRGRGGSSHFSHSSGAAGAASSTCSSFASSPSCGGGAASGSTLCSRTAVQSSSASNSAPLTFTLPPSRLSATSPTSQPPSQGNSTASPGSSSGRTRLPSTEISRPVPFICTRTLPVWGASRTLAATQRSSRTSPTFLTSTCLPTVSQNGSTSASAGTLANCGDCAGCQGAGACCLREESMMQMVPESNEVLRRLSPPRLPIKTSGLISAGTSNHDRSPSWPSRSSSIFTQPWLALQTSFAYLSARLALSGHSAPTRKVEAPMSTRAPETRAICLC